MTRGPLMPEQGGWTQKLSLRTQIVAANIFALSLLLAALGVVIHFTAKAAILDAVDRQLTAQIRPLVSGAAMLGGPPPPAEQPPPPAPNPPGSQDAGMPPELDNDPRRPPPGPRANDPYRPRMFDLAGRSMDPRQSYGIWDPAGFNRAKQGQRVFATLTVHGASLRVLSAPFSAQDAPRGVVQAAYPLDELAPAFVGLDRALLILIPVGLLCAGLAGAALTGSVLHRVRRTTLAAAHIGARDFSRRLPVTGSDEFSELAETFNRLLGRQEEAFRQQQILVENQRRFTADASHELKTPLTIIKGNADFALAAPLEEARPALREIQAATETMSHLVQDLLLLARSDGGQLARHPIEMLASELLHRAVRRARPAQAALRMALEDETLTVTGNESELVRLMSNLVDNAAQHTPVGGCITVAARRDGPSVVLSVADTGPGIPPEHLPHLGERFYRMDTSRARQDGGTGLGLSICKAIAEAHGGALQIQSRLGHGTTVSVRLPG